MSRIWPLTDKSRKVYSIHISNGLLVLDNNNAKKYGLDKGKYADTLINNVEKAIKDYSETNSTDDYSRFLKGSRMTFSCPSV